MSPRAVLARVASGVALLALGAPLTSAADTFSFAPYPLESGGQTHTVTVATQGDPLRTYQLTTTAPQRDSAAQQRAITERAGELQARSGNALFDALLAQALDDARLDSVSSIRDFAYNNNEPIACECFQTGEKWTYVWTRDTSYSTDLGLALLDPVRAATSMRFKISGFRTGMPLPAGLPADSLQIVQDTGSGGSWPVSSDRLTWALGAAAVLDQLDGEARKSFALEAYRALRGSLEADRAAIFDASDGLYSGEQSFLDWREQTYAPYVLKDLTQLAQTKALSTNVVHYAGLKLAARLAHEQHDTSAAARYAQQAEALKTAINDRLWLPELGLYASITTPDAHAAPVAKFDMLGEALAIVTGVASEARGRKILANYPHAPFGVPVYYPQQPDVAVYHNRAIWAFVSAYELLAAAQVKNTAVADNAFDSLTRAAALHLTNTENLEWLTGKSQYDDGPVINSRRQIWSVAGYVAMVAKVVFGFNVREDGVHIAPFLTAHMRDTLAGAAVTAGAAGASSGGSAATATLANLKYRGRNVRVVLHLPEHAAAGWFPVAGVTLNGQPVTGAIAAAKLQPDNVLDVRFGAATAGDARIRMAAQVSPLSHSDPQIFSPAVPEIALESGVGQPKLSVTNRGAGITYDIWRDGVRVEHGWSGDAWSDGAKLAAAVRHCYRVVARYTVSNNASHPSQTACVDADATRTIAWSDASVQTLPGSDTGGPDYRVSGVQIAAAGDYALSLTYDNHDFFINTGVTNAVKRLQVLDAQGRVVASAIVQMPHIGPEGSAHPLRQSTEARLHLPAGSYSVLVSDHFNMSYLQSNALFREIGGSSGARNRATISQLRITRWH